MTRERIDAELATWANGRGIDPADLRALSRRLHIATSTLARRPPTDKAIAAKVDRWKGSKDPIATASKFLNQSAISYAEQKVLQWLIAEAFTAGIKKGKAGSPILRPR